ncbi:MAG: phosphoribosyltransferase [Gemmatimonadales bacterium]
MALSTTRFLDRRDAGRRLASALREYARRTDVLVLGLPRGGVPVASEVASALEAPLDVLVVRKLGVPGQDELAMGAVASGGITVLNREVIEHCRVTQDSIDRVTQRELTELARRDLEYRGSAPPLDVAGRTVIVVDDGLATGATMSAAVAALRVMRPLRIVVAAPVASRDAMRLLRRTADDCVSVSEPEPFYGVGQWYDDFAQTTDREVRRLLADSREPAPAPALRS